MATQAELIELAGLIQVAHDRAMQLAAQPTTSEQLAAKDAQIATLASERDAALGQVTTLQGKIDTSKAKLDELSAQDAAADAAETAKINEARQALD